MRGIAICILLFFLSTTVFARHIKGGWVQYEYQGPGSAANTSVYKITIYIFKDCIQSGPMPTQFGIYDAVTYAAVTKPSASFTLQSSPTKTSFDPCLSNPPTICYQIYTYSTTVTLPDNTNGYTIAVQDANRVTGIVNINNSVNTGITFLGNIPGTANSIDYHVNSSPFFAFQDTAVICYNSNFTYQFNATDADGDKLTYSFGNGIDGTQTLAAPPYSSLSYSTGFAGASPLGAYVTIDSLTGLISGKAPGTTGDYVIAVYVHEWRNGVLFNSTKKELQINVANCSLSAASLQPSYINCDNFTFSFQNESTSSNITSYAWDFGVAGITTDVSSAATPTYTYADTGSFTIKLVVGNSGGCRDSTNALVKVYPGFTPLFTVSGSCYQSPFTFTDASTTKYGSIDSWSWNLGDTNSTTDTFSTRNTNYVYSAPGKYIALLSVTSTKGCAGAYSTTVTANDKPVITLAFKDTLICNVDSLPLKAQSAGTYAWTPRYNISDTSIANPVVFPKDTTTYTVTVTDQGCIDSAKVKVNVLTFITVKLPADTGICKTDNFILRPTSDALSYVWRESGSNSLSSYTTKNPLATPLVTTTYYVTANLGYCQDSAKMKVSVAPYPQAEAGIDQVICFGTRAQLNGNVNSAYFYWSPANSLSNTNILNPIAVPANTTSYILTVQDTSYCKKTVSDTVSVRVVPVIQLNAGKDTSAAVGQSLQLITSGADSSYDYQWSPAIYLSYLSNANVYNPVFLTTSTTLDSIRYNVKVTSPEGCASSDDIVIHIYRGGPDILVPSAFTPNGDGKNDVIRPILIGISKLEFFSIYNRWGDLLYTTTEEGKGWDGIYNTVKQPTGTYVYITRGEDVSGNRVFRKGTVVLIR